LLVLVVNTGSSSVKYRLVRTDRPAGEPAPPPLARGLVERIGEDGGPPDSAAAFATVFEELAASGALPDVAALDAVGHRVVHGGEELTEPTVVDDDVLEVLRRLVPLAPLHNPPNLRGLEVLRERYPDTPQVAVFDTGFHRTIPPEAHRYAVPDVLYATYGVRRYGFHGTSVSWVVKRAAAFLGRQPSELDAVVAHLGNGASVTAVRGGESVDTSMGLTPLAGLVMGTRSGDLDPGVVLHLARAGLAMDEVDALLNKHSGLRGLAGDNDMRSVTAAARSGDERAALALGVYVHRLRSYLGAYVAVLGSRPHALVLTGGVGENAAEVRERACAGLGHLGIELDAARNNGPIGDDVTPVHADGSPVQVLVVRTNEEQEIADQVAAALEGARARA